MKLWFLPLALASLGLPALAGNPPTIDYLEETTLTRSGRLSIHGKDFEQTGQVYIAGQQALVVPVPGTNSIEMIAYVPEDTPYGPADVVVVSSVGFSNTAVLQVVPRAPEGRKLWRFAVNDQLNIHRPALGADGTIYTKSQAGDLIALTPYGAMQWLLQLGSDLTPEVSIGSDGTIYTADGWPTVRAVNPDGTLKWSWADSPNQGVIAGPNVGPDGNIYVVTHLPGSGLISLTPQGQLRFVGPDNPYGPIGQIGQEIVFSSNQLFFCQDGVFDSFDFQGNHVFRKFTVTSSSSDSPQPAVGPSGDSYVEYWAQLKSYDPSGNEQWSAFGPGGNWLRDPDVGPDGTIYVMRNVFNTLHALNPDGSTKWTYNHPETLLNPVMDPTGKRLVIGGSGNLSSEPGFILALDEQGNPKWQFDLPYEQPDPWTTAKLITQGRARFTPDGSIAYVMVIGPSGHPSHSYVYAMQVGASADAGHGLAGAGGTPRLQLTSSLAPASPVSVELTGASPSATAHFVVGVQATAIPLLGGVVLPSPDLIFTKTVASDGKAQLTGTWPTGLPADTAVYVQAWVGDPTGPAGFSASNALSLIEP